MTKKAIERAIELLGSVVTEGDEELSELVRQLSRINVQTPRDGSSIKLYPLCEKTPVPHSEPAANGYQFRADIVTIVPTACLVEAIQALSRALNKAADADYAEYAESILRDEVKTTIDCLANDIEQFTVVPPDLEIVPSASSLIAMSMETGVIVGADGKDIPCRAGFPISYALGGACCQCYEECPHYEECFGGADEEIPRYGRISPMDMKGDLDTPDDAVVAYLDETLGNKG